MLAIFTSPRPFTTERYKKIQVNAVQSWIRLKPQPELILFGDEKHEGGIGELVQMAGCAWYKRLERNQWGTPLVGDLILKAQRLAHNDILAWVNTDIILLQDFMEAIKVVSQELRQFLLIGAKWRLFGEPPEIDFDSDWQKRLREYCKTNGERQPKSGSNYQVFTRELFRGRLFNKLEERPQKHLHIDFPIEFPPIAWGRIKMDTWLVWQALRRDIPVVDATDMILAIHQDHRHFGKKVILQDNGSTEKRLQEILTERKISGGGRISNATWVYDKKGLRRKQDNLC